MALTEAGETMLAYARRLLDLNDEAATAIHGTELAGLGKAWTAGRFRRDHSSGGTWAIRACSSEGADRGTRGSQCGTDRSRDVGQVSTWPWHGAMDAVTPHCEHDHGCPDVLGWPCRRAEGTGRASADEPLPLASLEAPCLLRTAATNALDRAGIPWRLAFVSPSLAGLWAATAAGLGVTIRTPIGLPASVQPLGAGRQWIAAATFSRTGSSSLGSAIRTGNGTPCSNHAASGAQCDTGDTDRNSDRPRRKDGSIHRNKRCAARLSAFARHFDNLECRMIGQECTQRCRIQPVTAAIGAETADERRSS